MKRFQLTPNTAEVTRIAGIYAFWGFLWILFSDQIILFFFQDANLLAKIQTIKGWFFILVTAALLFFLVKRSLEKLAFEQQQLANVMEATKTGTWEWHIKSGQLLVNDRCLAITGHSHAEIEPSATEFRKKLIHPDDLPKLNTTIKELKSGKRDSYECDYRLKHKNGSWVWTTERGKVIQKDSYNAPLVVAGTIHDITAKKKAEADLRLAHYCLDHSAIAIFSIDLDGKITMTNHTACQNLGYTKDEIYNLTLFDIDLNLNSEIWEQHRNKLNHKQVLTFESSQKRKDGSLFPVEVTINHLIFEEHPMYFSFVQDISQRKELQTELNQKNKMEAIGLLAGGMAHNFNNSLAIVLGNLEMAIRKNPKDSALTDYLDNAKAAALRSRDLISQIMTYSRKSSGTNALFNISDVLQETFTLLKSTTAATINLTLSVLESADNMWMHGDPSRIQEILLNLHGNAVHAVADAGDISITLEKVYLDSEQALGRDKNNHLFAKIRFSDNGCGIPEETLLRIFDPFFTTKKVNEGTGMGLATVKGIVVQHNGLINVTSKPGLGTEFNLYFPLADEQSANPVGRINTSIVKGSETILLVDDDLKLNEINQELLCELGYQVVSATNAEAALSILQEAAQRFSLVITDQTMPGLSGQQLAREIKKLYPQLPIILCTGYNTRNAEQNIDPRLFAARCFKPLQLFEVSQVIRKILDE